LSLGASACSEDLDTAAEIKTLRVLGVSADTPYASPGSNPELEMLLHDGAPGAVRSDGTRRPVQVVWIEGCVNPPGDLYYLCYPALHYVTDLVTDDDLRNEQVPAGVPIGFGTHLAATIPSDIISGRPQADDIVHPYGLSYVWFAACGGELRKLPDANPNEDFPLGCFRPGTNERLGSNDFDYGYFPIYAFESLRNANPQIDGVQFDQGASGAACDDVADCEAGEVCGKDGYCIATVPHCTEDDETKCPGYYFKPEVPRSAAERAEMATVKSEDAPLENLWVSYYSTAGTWKAESKMIHDPDVGYQSEFESRWRAPKSGQREVRLYAVVRDNRGGVSWVWRDIWVE